jgi:hypothetical protein
MKILSANTLLVTMLRLMTYPCVAQDSSTILHSSNNGTKSCELHIWPSEQVSGHGLYLYNGLIRGRASTDAIEKSMNNLLTPSSQMSAMHGGIVATSLGLPISTVIVQHQSPLDHKTINNIESRRSGSRSSCYFELFMTSHSLIEDVVWGDRFSSGFLFRNFGSSMTAKNVIKGVGGNKLKVFTQSDRLRPADAPQLVTDAVRANFLEYAKNARPKVASAINH